MSEYFTLREALQLAITHIRGMWRHRGNMLVTTWIVCGLGWLMITLMEDQYVSTARVVIEDPKGEVTSILKQMPAEFSIDITQEARRVLSSLLSRPNLERVIQETDLVQSVQSSEDRELLLMELSQKVTIGPIGRGSNVYKITHTHSKPQITKQVVDALLNILEADPFKPAGMQPNRMAQQFLDEQIKDYESRLAEADEALQQFKKKNAEILPNETGGYYKRLKDIQTELEKEKVKLRELEKRRTELQRQFSAISGRPGTDDDNYAQLYDQKIRETRTRIEEMLTRHYMRGEVKRYLYSEDHPEIIALRRQIQQLEQQKTDHSRSKDSRNELALLELENDPIMRQIKISISSVDVDMASSRGRIEEFLRQVDELRGLENTIPTVEAELIRLERNANIIREKLLSLLDTQGKVTLGGDMVEGLSKHVRVRIIDRPHLPAKPSGPNRPLFLSVVLLGGVLAGLMMSLVFSIMRPVFDSPSSIKKELGLPVLGTVSLVVDSRKGSIIQAPVVFFSLISLLLVTYLILIIPKL